LQRLCLVSGRDSLAVGDERRAGPSDLSVNHFVRPFAFLAQVVNGAP
jgi:hypothetical protein